MRKNTALFIKLFLILLLVFVGGGGAGYVLRSQHEIIIHENQQEKDKYNLFITEVYQTIQENFWENIDDDQLSQLYLKALEKVSINSQTLEENNLNGVLKLWQGISSNKSDEEKNTLLSQATDIVLANLPPFGRSRLYTQKLETDLQNTVSNIDPQTDLYDVLEIDKKADQQQIENSYQKLAEKWDPDTNSASESAAKYSQIKRAYRTLSEEENRQQYDLSGVEPTINYQTIGDKIFWLHLTKFSPTSLAELEKTANLTDNYPELDTLIFDLRDNIGGAIDSLPYFLGPFIGPDQYAYQYFQQGEKQDFKSQNSWLSGLVKFKKVVILINENSQSSAELMAASLKKYNVGVLVGTTTKGWGTIEKVFPLKNQISDSEKYSIFLVHHLTLREDGQSIEGKGVDPMIDIHDPNWQNELNKYYNYPELSQAVADIFAKKYD